jgi:predicted nucleic acid-binding protein
VIAYLDSSVVLRVVLKKKGRLRQWDAIEPAVSSALLRVECLRTLDRLRHRRLLEDEEIAWQRAAVLRAVERMQIVELTRSVMDRAEQPFPTPLGPLDAIHLITALLWRESMGTDLTLATHDGALALAARAVGFDVLGA